MLTKIRRYFLWLAIAIVIIAAWFLVSGSKTTSSKTQNQQYTVVAKDIVSVLSLSGTVDAEEKTELQFQTSGQLAWVGVKEGDYVQKWQAIASLDQRELKQNLQKKLNDYLDARWDHEQLKDDYQSQETAQWNTYLTDEITRIVQQSQFGLNKTVIDVELSQLAIDLSTIISPLEGIVTHIDQPLAGVNITPATARFEIVNPNTLYLKVVVDQQDIVKLKKGLEAQIIFDSFPDKLYSGKVYYLSFKPAEGEENSYLVKISIPKQIAAKLRLGMAAEIILTVGEAKKVLAVPFLAISQEGTKSYVTVLKPDNQTEKRQIITGLENDDYVEVKKGLNKGEVVVY